MNLCKSAANLGFCLLACGWLGKVAAQTDPRLTGAAVIAQLEAAQRGLSARAEALPGSTLIASSQHLLAMSAELRKALDRDAAKPLAQASDEAQAQTLRAYAAATQAQAYLGAASSCFDGDAVTMARALDATINLLANAPRSSKSEQPVITAVETEDHHPLFAFHGDSQQTVVALLGVNLHDAQCDDPLITATNGQGAMLSQQPAVTSVLPNRIELKVPGGVEAGSYVLHVLPKRKLRFLGCTTQPEANVALQVAPPIKFSVSYTLTQSCRVRSGKVVVSEQPQPAVSGVLPDITAYGATVSQAVVTAACNDPVSTSISSKVLFADGNSAAIGAITQSASAGITVGLPGGLTLRWEPAVKTVFVSAATSLCTAVAKSIPRLPV